jgi:Flp pilus assembly pilin Flp
MNLMGFRQIVGDAQGATAVEYGVLVASIFLAGAFAVKLYGDKLSALIFDAFDVISGIL